jgi:putative transposase
MMRAKELNDGTMQSPDFTDTLLDQLLAGTDARSALDPGGLLDGLKKALTERALNAEMDHHLGGEDEAENRRNGYGTDSGKLEIDVPRDRAATFDPQLIAKYQRRCPGFDEKIVSMYARGMSTREIAGHLRDLLRHRGLGRPGQYGAVLDEVAAWQMRPLEPVYPLVFFDALRVKIRDESLQGYPHRPWRAGAKEILGMWIELKRGGQNSGMNELNA